MRGNKHPSPPIGTEFGWWTVIGKAVEQKVLCRCRCGLEKMILISSLHIERTTKCRNCSNKESGRQRKEEYPPIERFWDNVGNGPILYPAIGRCWIWKGYKDPDGYGHFKVNGRRRGAHYFAWLFTYGPIAEGEQVLHHCDNPSCVRPSHLWLGDGKANMADRDSKGRCAHGETHGMAKLTDAEVMEILKKYVKGSSRRGTHGLGREYGVSHTLIRYIVNGKWRRDVYAQWVEAGRPKI